MNSPGNGAFGQKSTGGPGFGGKSFGGGGGGNAWSPGGAGNAWSGGGQKTDNGGLNGSNVGSGRWYQPPNSLSSGGGRSRSSSAGRIGGFGTAYGAGQQGVNGGGTTTFLASQNQMTPNTAPVDWSQYQGPAGFDKKGSPDKGGGGFSQGPGADALMQLQQYRDSSGQQGQADGRAQQQADYDARRNDPNSRYADESPEGHAQQAQDRTEAQRQKDHDESSWRSTDQYGNVVIDQNQKAEWDQRNAEEQRTQHLAETREASRARQRTSASDTTSGGNGSPWTNWDPFGGGPGDGSPNGPGPGDGTPNTGPSLGDEGDIQTSVNPIDIYSGQQTQEAVNRARQGIHGQTYMPELLANGQRQGVRSDASLSNVANAYNQQGQGQVASQMAGVDIPFQHQMANATSRLAGERGRADEFSELFAAWSKLAQGQRDFDFSQNQAGLNIALPALKLGAR